VEQEQFHLLLDHLCNMLEAAAVALILAMLSLARVAVAELVME
jgi:hypothetical protein